MSPAIKYNAARVLLPDSKQAVTNCPLESGLTRSSFFLQVSQRKKRKTKTNHKKKKANTNNNMEKKKQHSHNNNNISNNNHINTYARLYAKATRAIAYMRERSCV